MFVPDCEYTGSGNYPRPSERVVGMIPGTGWKALHLWYDHYNDKIVREFIPVIAWIMREERHIGYNVRTKEHDEKGWLRYMVPIIAGAAGYAWDSGDLMGEDESENSETPLCFRDDEDPVAVTERCDYAAEEFEKRCRANIARKAAASNAKAKPEVPSK